MNLCEYRYILPFNYPVHEPAWPSGKQKDPGMTLLQLTFLFQNCDLWTLSRDLALHN